MRIGSLFSGIGGLELGLERAGVGHTVWQVEQSESCRKVLARHWPEAQRFDDVKTVGSHNLAQVDVICGGFPCQDISIAGNSAGIEGDQSGLWSEYARIVCELRPRFVFVENVAALTFRGLDRVLGDLARLGYDAEWTVLSAADVGAPHRRRRIWILAHRPSTGQVDARCVASSDADKVRRSSAQLTGSDAEEVASAGMLRPWSSEPAMGRVAHGIPRRVDRVAQLGNAVVPQCASAAWSHLYERAIGRKDT